MSKKIFRGDARIGKTRLLEEITYIIPKSIKQIFLTLSPNDHSVRNQHHASLNFKVQQIFCAGSVLPDPAVILCASGHFERHASQRQGRRSEFSLFVEGSSLTVLSKRSFSRQVSIER